MGVFGPGFLLDPSTMLPVAGRVVAVTDPDTGEPVTTTEADGTTPRTVVTNLHGHYPQFHVASTWSVLLSAGGVEEVVAAIDRDPGGGGGGGAVDSVNGQTGAVVLSASDVGAATSAQGALADTAVQPGDLADVATSGAYADLSGTPTIPSSPGDIGAAPASHTHTASDVTSSGASSGEVLTADGSGGAAWAEPSGGGGGGFPFPPVATGSHWGGFMRKSATRPLTAGNVVFTPLPVGRPTTLTGILVRVETAAAGATLSLGVYDTDAFGVPGSLTATLGTVDASTTGDKTITGLALTLQSGLYWVATLDLGENVSVAAQDNNHLAAMFAPHRQSALERPGGFTSGTGLAALPATSGLTNDAWDSSPNAIFYAMQAVTA